MQFEMLQKLFCSFSCSSLQARVDCEGHIPGSSMFHLPSPHHFASLYVLSGFLSLSACSPVNLKGDLVKVEPKLPNLGSKKGDSEIHLFVPSKEIGRLAQWHLCVSRATRVCGIAKLAGTGRGNAANLSVNSKVFPFTWCIPKPFRQTVCILEHGLMWCPGCLQCRSEIVLIRQNLHLLVRLGCLHSDSSSCKPGLWAWLHSNRKWFLLAAQIFQMAFQSLVSFSSIIGNVWFPALELVDPQMTLAKEQALALPLPPGLRCGPHWHFHT